MEAAKDDVLCEYRAYLVPGVNNWGGHWLVTHTVTNCTKGVMRNREDQDVSENVEEAGLAPD